MTGEGRLRLRDMRCCHKNAWRTRSGQLERSCQPFQGTDGIKMLQGSSRRGQQPDKGLLSPLWGNCREHLNPTALLYS